MIMAEKHRRATKRRYLKRGLVAFILLTSLFAAHDLLTHPNLRTPRSPSHLNISVVTIFANQSDNYQIALGSLECYCLYQQYTFVPIYTADKPIYQELCPQRNRHCIAAHFLRDNNYTHILFVDADMGVINPNRRIEEFLLDGKDLVFYERVFNIEIMAGSFIARKSEFTVNFLQQWANFDLDHLEALHGYDNVALHHMILGLTSKNLDDCKQLETICAPDLYFYIACVRIQLRETNEWEKSIAVLEKTKAWARDGWLTNSLWCENDFFFHGWQKSKLHGNTSDAWSSPLRSLKFGKKFCKTNSYMRSWKYNKDYIKKCADIDDLLQWQIRQANKRHTIHILFARKFLADIHVMSSKNECFVEI